jgi:hypothetical protein
MTDFSPDAFIASTFFRRLASANGPFLSERAILILLYHAAIS